jgi:predicted transcriptional regulator
MEVRFSAEKEARLREVAVRTGREATQVIEEAVDRLLEYQSRFTAAVEKGRASARRGDLLEHDELIKGIDRLLSFESS